MKEVKLFSAVAIHASLNLVAVVDRVLKSHSYILGQEVACFEKEFLDYIGVQECQTVANGTDALELALKGVGVNPGDRVATVANAGFYSSTAIHAVGATPLYVDIDETTLTMSLSSLKSVANENSCPKAVILTHLYGQLAPNILEIQQFCKEAGVKLIEDCAQSTGASLYGKKAGSFGDIATFSFYPTKNLGALGDGGAIVTDNLKISERIKKLRQYGWSEKYKVSLAGGCNSRMDEIQAAILREKLPCLDQWNEVRRAIAITYNEQFSKLPLQCPFSLGSDYVAHLYVIRVKRDQRDSLRHFLRERGVATDVHYPIPDHLQVAYPQKKKWHLPITEFVGQRIVSLPCYPGLAKDEQDWVATQVKEFFIK